MEEEYSSNHYQDMVTSGYTNKDSDDLSRIAGQESKDLRATFCNSPRCHKGLGRRGEIIHIGTKYKSKCQFCNSDEYLFYDTLSNFQGERFRQLLEAKRLRTPRPQPLEF